MFHLNEDLALTTERHSDRHTTQTVPLTPMRQQWLDASKNMKPQQAYKRKLQQRNCMKIDRLYIRAPTVGKCRAAR